MDKRLQVAWVAHLKSEEEKKGFEQLVRNSTQVLGRLKDILSQRLEGLYQEEEKADFYEGNVSHNQTRVATQRSEIKNILKLLEFF